MNFNLCSGIPIFQTSKGKKNWLENRVVREIVEGGGGDIQRGKGSNVDSSLPRVPKIKGS